MVVPEVDDRHAQMSVMEVTAEKEAKQPATCAQLPPPLIPETDCAAFAELTSATTNRFPVPVEETVIGTEAAETSPEFLTVWARDIDTADYSWCSVENS